MKKITLDEAVVLHEDKFGTRPVLTGAEFWNEKPIEQRIIEAIENGTPYVEEELSDNQWT